MQRTKGCRDVKKAKQTKASTNYRPTKTTRNCGNCRYMHDDGTCAKVQGQVDRRHVCDLFEREATS
jgi:hypothetical protein